MTAVLARNHVHRANARPIGRVEFRHVKMEIGSGQRARTLEIRTLRESVSSEVARTAFCVMQPRMLSNINYVVNEYCGRMEPFSIQLYLPYVLGSLRDVRPERRGECLLGSDFSYDDLRTWLYEEDHEYENALVDGSVVRVRGTCVGKAHLVRQRNAPFDIWLSLESAFLMGIDYWSLDESRVVRQYRADDLRHIENVIIPGRMTMVDHVRNHTTTINLVRACFDRPIERKFFEPSFRKHTRDYLATW